MSELWKTISAVETGEKKEANSLLCSLPIKRELFL